MRVVSVLPSATEIVCALGHTADLVGRSAECDYPAEIGGLPAVMWPRTLDSDQPSGMIDDRVRRARGADESLYYLDVERLRSLRPDLLLTQDLCGVCSVTTEEVGAACSQAGVAPEVVSLTPRTLPDVLSTFSQVADALHDPSAGARLVAATRQQVERPSSGHGTVAVVEWLDPPILAGLWSSDIVRAAGGTPLGPAPGAHAERLTWEELAARQPDLVLFTPCSFSVTRTLRELKLRKIREGAARLRPPMGVYVADEAYFSRPGPRLGDGVQLVRSLLTGERPTTPMPFERWLPSGTTVRS